MDKVWCEDGQHWTLRGLDPCPWCEINSQVSRAERMERENVELGKAWSKQREVYRSARERAEKAERQRDKLKNVVEDVLNWALANRGTKNEFVRCYTYSAGDYPEEIVNALHAIGEKTGRACAEKGEDNGL